MNKPQQILSILGIVLAFFLFAIYPTCIQGKTDGPDFLESARTGKINADSIESIQVLIPSNSNTPFHLSEIEAMQIEHIIAEKAKIKALLDSLSKFGKRGIPQNHPHETYRRFLRVNTTSGFYLVYCSIHSDENSNQFTFNSNTLNATNPNGATGYHAASFQPLLDILKAPIRPSQPPDKGP